MSKQFSGSHLIIKWQRNMMLALNPFWGFPFPIITVLLSPDQISLIILKILS